MKIEISNEELSLQLYRSFSKEQIDRVINLNNECDLEPCIMGFVESYYLLSQIIPKTFTIVDIGSAFAPQCYFFKDHKRYIAVEPSVKEIFKMDNTELYNVKAGAFIDNILPTLDLDMDKTFAICQYVPDWHGDKPIELTRNTFKNCYTYYPS